jgi:hypothetical protein
MVVPNGVKYIINAPNVTPFVEIHMFGNARERGLAQGLLMGDEIFDFVETQLPAFYRQEVGSINLNGLPAWLQRLIRSALEPGSEKIAPAAFNAAEAYVFERQQAFLKAGRANLFDEIDGMAEGVCNTQAAGGRTCDQSSLAAKLMQVNMLPELLRMQCSMMGAWGPATPTGQLVQLRTLDFGAGPMSNHTFIAVHHPSDSSVSFATFTFPAFVGAVTGFSEKLGLSEKVDDVSNGKGPTGSYDGQAAIMVIRDILQFAETKEAAVAIASNANRTWPMWLGFGDYTSMKFVAILYDQAAVVAYDDTTLPLRTNGTHYPSVAYIDKHPQPSSNPGMPSLVHQFYGNLSGETVAQNFPRLMQSADVHAAVYDFGEKKAYLARGVTDSNGDFTRYAYQSPFLRFDMPALWAERKPACRALPCPPPEVAQL